MEDTLRESQDHKDLVENYVLILVLMEDTLRGENNKDYGSR